ncbi:MAG: hypothetical protein MI923_07045 [Phycisphaerales bacterium]|nr:hypothetical protein [Phycisphaerales bacterium]
MSCPSKRKRRESGVLLQLGQATAVDGLNETGEIVLVHDPVPLKRAAASVAGHRVSSLIQERNLFKTRIEFRGKGQRDG